MRTLWLILLSGLLAVSAQAAEPKAFNADSLKQIEARHAGKPFILVLWSANWCGYCIEELDMLGRLAKTEKRLPLVLVSVDSPEDGAAIRQTLSKAGLAHFESWVFDDAVPERLRAAIDPSWMGELPRTYLYDKRHRRQAAAGKLETAQLKTWLKQQHE